MDGCMIWKSRWGQQEEDITFEEARIGGRNEAYKITYRLLLELLGIWFHFTMPSPFVLSEGKAGPTIEGILSLLSCSMRKCICQLLIQSFTVYLQLIIYFKNYWLEFCLQQPTVHLSLCLSIHTYVLYNLTSNSPNSEYSELLSVNHQNISEVSSFLHLYYASTITFHIWKRQKNP